MPIDPVAENTIEDENDADFELDDLFKEPNNRSMAAVITTNFCRRAHQGVLFQQSEGITEKEPVGRLTNHGLWWRTRALCCMGFRCWPIIRA
jgi:hypothetical protein